MSIGRRHFVATFAGIASIGNGANAGKRFRVDAAEAEAVLKFLDGKPGWEHLWNTEGYVRLKKREISIGRAFPDDAFEKFLRTDDLRNRKETLRTTLAEWKKTDFEAIAKRIRAYLPARAKIEATVYIVIKPASNSFVFELATNPAIFLYLNPQTAAKKFANTVAHELHHVGLASLGDAPAGGGGNTKWIGAFGEGLAMLAAAGGPNIHPHLDSPAEDRARWDRDVANSPRDMRAVERFLLDAMHGKLGEKQETETAMSFFGETQGPWYTLGWLMAAVVEKAQGRKALIACMPDLRKLLIVYNEVARGGDAQPKWSPELIGAFSGGGGSGH